MPRTETSKPTALPFGKHKDQDLTTVPGSYLTWAYRECKLSSGLRAAVYAELHRRGVVALSEPPPKPEPECDDCGPGYGLRYLWGEDRIGRRFIRRECYNCGRSFGAAPLTAENIAAADAVASPTALLDVLVAVEEQGIGLRNDGEAVDFRSGDDWRKASQELRQRLRQCRHSLARMLRKDATCA